ncbi:hypothetical protein GWK47_038131 [Chionoecetes opilio]|uniref:Uncharacterized protein n=1 Tax=Chionoecetes opilio TaxID=41210 RepID=A0A8J4YFP5_CHIOP|nr:hypothetical protein GWK47_038131 [Chionoecetes opilio]
MMTNREDKEFLLAQREPGRRGKEGRRRFRPCCSGDEAISSLGKGRAFSARKQEEAAASSSVAQLESSPSSSSNTSALSQMKNTEQLEERACEAGEKGHEEHRLSSNGGHAGSNQVTDRSGTYVLTGKPHVAQARTSKSSTSTAHPSDANA